MENSFYYFFSSVPQVLGAILALFGVFVVFKIQLLTNLLISIAKDIAKILESFQRTENDLNGIYKAIDENSIKDLYTIIAALGDGFFCSEMNPMTPMEILGTHNNNKVRFATLYFIYENIRSTTIITTIFTAVIIVVCLVVIPFIKILTDCPCLLFGIFGIVVICTGIILWKLICILKKAIK